MKTVWISAVCLFVTGSLFAQSANYHLVKKTTIGGEGGWDYLLADPVGSRLYVSHGTQVEVLDLKSHEKVGVITPTPGIHGIAVVPGTAVGYTTNGRPNTATMFDTKSLKALKEIPTGKKPDAIMYDAFSKRVFIFNNEGASVTVLDAATGNVAGTVELGGAPEAAVSDDHGTIFVNLEDKNEIAVFDARSLAVKHQKNRLAWLLTNLITNCSVLAIRSWLCWIRNRARCWQKYQPVAERMELCLTARQDRLSVPTAKAH